MPCMRVGRSNDETGLKLMTSLWFQIWPFAFTHLAIHSLWTKKHLSGGTLLYSIMQLLDFPWSSISCWLVYYLSFQPIRNYNEWRLLYFISFLLLVGFFVLNMFVGVVVENFHRCREAHEKEEREKREQRRLKKLAKKIASESDSESECDSMLSAGSGCCDKESNIETFSSSSSLPHPASSRSGSHARTRSDSQSSTTNTQHHDVVKCSNHNGDNADGV